MSETSIKVTKDLRIENATDDTEVAATVAYIGSGSTHTVGLVSTTLTLTDADGANAFDLSASGYDTFGELQDAINALGDWKLIRVGALRADYTYNSALRVMTITAGTACAPDGNGVNLLFDTSANTFKSVGIGRCADTSLPAGARIMTRTQPAFADPSVDTIGNSVPKTMSDSRTIVRRVNAIGTNGNTNTLRIIKCSDSADGTAETYAATSATWKSLGSTELGEGAVSGEGEWYVVRWNASSSAVTSSSIIVEGGYGETA